MDIPLWLMTFYLLMALYLLMTLYILLLTALHVPLLMAVDITLLVAITVCPFYTRSLWFMAWFSLLVQFIGKLLLSVLFNLFVVMLETLVLVSVMFRVFYAVLHVIVGQRISLQLSF